MQLRSLAQQIILLALLALGGCSEGTQPEEKPRTTAITDLGPILVLGLQSWPAIVEVQGTLYGDEQAVVGAKVAGLVKTVHVDLGSPVTQGDVLAVVAMEDFDLRVSLVEAQMESIRAKIGLHPGEDEAKLDRQKAPPVRLERTVLEEARAKLERARILQAQRAIAIEELQNLEALLRVAEAKLDTALNLVDEQLALLAVMKQQRAQAVQSRNDATIRASFDGIVLQRFAAPGVYLQVGAPVATLVRTNPLRFRTGIPEREALTVAEKQSLLLHIQGVKEPINGTITRIAPALDPNSRALMVEVDIPNAQGKLRPGLFAQGTITTDPSAQALAVPLGAVTTFAGVEKVWKVEKGQPREIRIRTGRREQGRVEVLDGLKPGDVILAEPRR